MAKRRRSKTPAKIETRAHDEIEPPPAAPAMRAGLLSAVVLGYFVLLFGFISVSSLLQKSATIDEPTHLFAGYAHLKWGDYRANPEHPPLAKIWAALPLLALDIKDPRPGRPHWSRILEDSRASQARTANVARDMIFVDNDAETLFFYAKLQMVALALALGVFVFFWTRELFGLSAAAVALYLYALDPNILAHSQIVHTDIAFAAGFVGATYFFWRALGRLTWASLLLTSIGFGLAAITKYSYLAILLAWGVLGLMKIFSSAPLRLSLGAPRVVSERAGKTLVVGLILASALMAAYLSIWSAYRFRFDAVVGGGHLPTAQLMPERGLARAAASFAVEHRIFPEAWIAGQLSTLKELRRPAYLLEETAAGFWSYFPIAFAVKTPLPTLILSIAAVAGLWTFNRRCRADGLFLLVPPAIYFSLAVATGINIGLRHILPVYPFLFVLIGGAAVALWRATPWMKTALVALAVWFFWSSMRIYPDYLAYFNELAGGPANGHVVLVDSSLDWGQDLKGLKRWMDEREVKRIRLLYFGGAYPEYYGIDAVYLPGSWISYDAPGAARAAETPQYLAVSACILFGTEIFYKGDSTDFEKKAFIRGLRTKEAVAVIGHSIHVFKMS